MLRFPVEEVKLWLGCPNTLAIQGQGLIGLQLRA